GADIAVGEGCRVELRGLARLPMVEPQAGRDLVLGHVSSPLVCARRRCGSWRHMAGADLPFPSGERSDADIVQWHRIGYPHKGIVALTMLANPPVASGAWWPS